MIYNTYYVSRCATAVFFSIIIPFGCYAIPQDQGAKNTVTYSLDELKIIVPAAVSILILIVTNIITLLKIRMVSRESLKSQLTVDLIQAKKEQLERFYDPIFALINTNSAVLNAFGPSTEFKNLNHKREAKRV